MVNDLEIELAELKGFTRALALFSILSWVIIILVVGFILWEVNSIPSKDLTSFNSALDNYRLITI